MEVTLYFDVDGGQVKKKRIEHLQLLFMISCNAKTQDSIDGDIEIQ